MNNKNKKIIIIIAIVVAIILLLLVAIIDYKKFLVNKGKDFNKDSTTFFIRNNDGKYALFDENGKKLTDFIYTNVGEFIGGTTVVTKDKQYGIISSDGKMKVKFGKYSYIEKKGGVYDVEQGNNRYIINGNGKILYNDNIFINKYTNLNNIILEDKKNKTYNLISPTAKNLFSVPIKNNKELVINDEEGNYVSIFYNGNNTIIDSITGKKVTSFNSEQQYCINYIRDDMMILNSCKSVFSNNNSKTIFKIIDKGRLYDIENECEDFTLDTESDNIICHYKSKYYFLDKNYKRTTEYSNMMYKDSKNYAKNKDNLFDGVDFYKDGTIANTVTCRDLNATNVYVPSGIYLLSTYFNTSCNTKSGTYEYYNSNGEKMFNKSFTRAYPFDINNNAVVTESKSSKKTDYYLIDIKGNKISKLYDNIDERRGYYIVEKDNKKGIVDKKGKEILPCQYSTITIDIKKNNIIAELITDSKTTIYNLSNNKEIVSSNKDIELYERYVLVEDNLGKYYSYLTGKMFYEDK